MHLAPSLEGREDFAPQLIPAEGLSSRVGGSGGEEAWEPEGYGGAFVEFAFDGDFAEVEFDDCFYDGESEPCSLLALRFSIGRPEEWREHAGDVVGGDSDSRIGDAYREFSIGSFNAQCDFRFDR